MDRARRKRDWVKRVMLPVGVAAALGVVDFLLQAPKDVRRFEYVPGPLSQGAYDALAAHPGWAKDEIQTAPGVTLRGLVRKPSAAPARWILFFAGNGDRLLEDSQKFLDAVRGDRDIGLAVYAYRGFDGSGGEARQAGILADTGPIFRHVCESQKVDPKQIHLAGFSLGTNVSTYLASSGVGAASLTLLAPLTYIDVVPRSRFRRWIHGDRYDTRPLLAKVPGPVLVLHGSEDTSLPIAMGRAIAASLGDRARFVEVADASHTGLLDSHIAQAAVRSFVTGDDAH